MNRDERENYGQEDQGFPNNERRYEGQEVENLSADHSFTNNAEPDYGNDLNIEKLDNENLGNNEFNTPELDIEQLDEELSNEEDSNELGGENFENEGLDGIDDDDEINTDRPL